MYPSVSLSVTHRGCCCVYGAINPKTRYFGIFRRNSMMLRIYQSLETGYSRSLFVY